MSELTEKQKQEIEVGDDCVIGKYFLIAVKKGSNPRDIVYSVAPGAVVPEEYLRLQTQIDHTSTVLSILFPGEDDWSRLNSAFISID